jgi:3-methyladenine DNA glycosylase/8-oxoguanine DNA glycosylase
MITIRVPPPFDFWRTAFSHGWCDLLPFEHDPDRKILYRVVVLDDGTIVRCTLKGTPDTISIATDGGSLDGRQRREVRTQLRDCLRLNEDFSDFHEAARRYPHYRWIARTGMGRLLRSPTVFEDVVKTICTTNCTWALTTIMVRNLVRCFGPPSHTGAQGFPTPASIAGSTEAFLRKNCTTGYRSPYLLEFATRVASGTIDPESWRTSSLRTSDLFERVRDVKGIGPYGAGNIMKLLGRYDYLGLDSWVRAKYYELHRGGRKVKDATIERDYARYGEWRGLFFWLEMTRYWHDEKFRLPTGKPAGA